jgi:putative acetyltransferase
MIPENKQNAPGSTYVNPAATVLRTNTDHPGFRSLIKELDHELWNELEEDQATYDQFNKVPDIKTAILVYVDDEVVACGCFKEKDLSTVEIKRMFVKKNFRRKGNSKIVLRELEQWAIELGFSFAVLETSIHFDTAKKLYHTNGYDIIENYPPYVGLEESVCMKKTLK